MTESLLSIGVFGRAAGLSVSTLRFYDEVGLLPAAHVDPRSGYRYYDATQQDQARLLALLRSLDLPVPTMAELIGLPVAERRLRLDELAEQIEASAAQRAHDLRRLNLTEPTAGAVGWVDALQAADALDRVSQVAGEPGDAPFDHVLVVIENSTLTWLACDRYRLARYPVRSKVPGAGHARVLLGPHQVVRVRQLLETVQAGDAEVRINAESLQVDDHATPALPAADFPDLTALHTLFAGDCTHRLRMPTPTLNDAGDRASIETPHGAVMFTTRLLTDALDTLLGKPVMLHYGAPLRPVLLTCAGQPDHTIAIQPCRPNDAPTG